MEKNTKLILAAVALVMVGVVVAIVISFQNRQKQLEAEKNAALITNQNGNVNGAPTVQGTVLSLVNLAIAALRAKKKAQGVANPDSVTSSEVKSYLADSGAIATDNFDMPENTTWNGAETYGG